PLCLNRTRFYGIPARILESIYNAHTPRFEFPMCTARQDEVHALLWKTMADIPCDAIVLKQFPSQSATLAALQASASASGWCTGTTQGAREPFIVFDADPLQQVNSKQRYNLRKRLRDLGQKGEVQLEQ